MKTWFTILWGIEACKIDGPYGDDPESAKEFVRSELKETEEYEQGGIFAVDLERVD